MRPAHRKCPDCGQRTMDVGDLEWCSKCGDYVVDRVIRVDVGRLAGTLALLLGVSVAIGAALYGGARVHDEVEAARGGPAATQAEGGFRP